MKIIEDVKIVMSENRVGCAHTGSNSQEQPSNIDIWWTVTVDHVLPNYAKIIY